MMQKIWDALAAKLDAGYHRDLEAIGAFTQLARQTIADLERALDHAQTHCHPDQLESLEAIADAIHAAVRTGDTRALEQCKARLRDWT